ncbi:hypothetical protein KAR91_62620 [Candidatus Pacearchaeota archaeon]|nr:hypothetical protein [Candidatus Pacearchaeota archaeon]
MPPKLKSRDCDKCSRSKLRNRVVFPQSNCEGRPDLLILGSAPSLDDDKGGLPFSDRAGVQYLRTIVPEVTNNYVMEMAVRCFSNGSPTTSAITACKPNWMATVKKHNPKVVMTLGKFAAEAVLSKKVKLASVVGQSLEVDYDGTTIPTIFNYSPDYVANFADKKGGEAEKTEKLWFDVWDIAQEVLKKGLSAKPKVRILTKYEHCLKFLDFLRHDFRDLMSYDYETWGDRNTLRPELCNEFKILTIGVGYKEKGIAFPLDYPKHFSESQIAVLAKKWSVILREEEEKKVAHNAKYEHKCNYSRLGFTRYLYDTMLIMNILNELAPSSLGAVGRHFGFTWSGYKIEMSGIQQNPIDTSLDELLEYNALDALLCHGVHGVGIKELDEAGIKLLHMKQNYALHLAQVEMNGMHVNEDQIEVVREKLVGLKSEAEDKLLGSPHIKKVENWCLAYKKEKGKLVLDKKGKKQQNIKSFKKGSIFNPKSPVQMKRLCLNELKLPVKPKVKWKGGKRTESYSFDKRALEQFEDTHPIVKDLNALRSINAMFSGFLDKWQTFLGPDGCVHTNYNQDVVLTGRLSSTEPNLQNIPVESIIKVVFSSRYGIINGRILSADYKQLEPRILAGWSEDPAMCEALNGGFDLHKFVAAKIHDVLYDDVTFTERQLGKRMNLGQMYGQTPEGLAVAASISLEHAKELQITYFTRFPGIKDFRVKFHVAARRTGESIDLFGGVRHLPNAMLTNRMLKERAERQASNYPIQSTGNHFCLLGMCKVMDLFKERKLPAIVVGTVHDSIIVDFDNSYQEEIVEAVNEGMLMHNFEDYWKDKPVPMEIDIAIGPNYKELAGV